MKTKIPTTFYMLLLAVALVFTACSGNTEKEGNSSAETSENGSTESQGEKSPDMISFTSQETTHILNSYLAIKDALVETDGKATKAAAQKLVSVVGETGGELMNKIKFDAEHIGETEDTGHQRDHLNSLSDNVYKLVQTSESNGGKIYLQFCPMAFDNTGAYWLSNSSEIMNPYFGDQMLHCGKVEEEI